MQDPKPVLSIIILSYNTRRVTKDCLNSIFESLKNSKISYEIIVIDNASNDGSQQMLNQLKSKRVAQDVLKLIFNKQNLGFARGNNQAVKTAQGEYLLFLNSDIVVLSNAIENLLKFHKQNEYRIDFLGGKLLNKNFTTQPSCGPFYSLPIIFAALFLRGDYWGLTRYSPDKTKEVDWVSGACILTKKEHFKKISGFDEDIFMYMDEIDLLYRAKQKGKRVFFYPKSRFLHLGFASSGGKSYPVIQVYKGLLYFYRKHHNKKRSLFLLKFMLKLKALIAILLGKLSNNRYLISTYEQAYKLTSLDR